jgi:purine-binding chemotaxis protein CheW
VSNEATIGKYLTFQLADETYGIEILKAREIIGLIAVTKIPHTPDFILGIVNLRGKVIPVVDLRTKFGMPYVEPTEQTCIVVVDLGNFLSGILVDSVSEVVSIDQSNVEPAPAFGEGIDTSFIIGIGKLKERVVLLLDIEMVLSRGGALDIVGNLSESGTA